MYFVSDMYHTWCHFAMFILTCYIHEQTLCFSLCWQNNIFDVEMQESQMMNKNISFTVFPSSLNCGRCWMNLWQLIRC
jgi:hypothetical protein